MAFSNTYKKYIFNNKLNLLKKIKYMFDKYYNIEVEGINMQWLLMGNDLI